MKDSLIIVHANDKLTTMLNKRYYYMDSVLVLRKSIRDRVAEYAGKSKPILYTPFEKMESSVPEYLSEFSRKITFITTMNPKVLKLVFEQSMKCREILLQGGCETFEIGGLYKNCCVGRTKYLVETGGDEDITSRGLYGTLNMSITNPLFVSKDTIK